MAPILDTLTFIIGAIIMVGAVLGFLYFWTYKILWKGIIARSDPLWSPPKDDEDEDTAE